MFYLEKYVKCYLVLHSCEHSRLIIMEKVKMDKAVEKKFFCNACNINLLNENSMQQHLSGRKHLAIVRNKEERSYIERKCSLFIAGFPAELGHEWLLEYFAIFGTIAWSFYDSSYLLLDYSEPTSASTVINQKHCLRGKNLIVRYRELKTINAAAKVVNTGPMADDFLDLIKNIPDLENQVYMLSSHVQGGDPQIQIYDRVCRELCSALSPSFPDFEIFPFGSTVTGLYFKTSDLDVYIAGIRQQNESSPYLYKIRTALRRCQLFGNIKVIANAKIPILRCVHFPSGTNCDINVRNMLGVCNSNLMRYFLNLDIKIKKLMLVMKYWAKCHRLTGQNNLFTNYSLNLMVIFFLQQSPYQVPSVFSLQDLNYQNIQDGWDGGFSLKAFHTMPLKMVTFTKLLTEFFIFYSNFEYEKYIICPYLGVTLKKTDFKNPELLCDGAFDLYKKYLKIKGNMPLKFETSICVQDPFEHSRNTTPIISDVTLSHFVLLCRLGKTFCKKGENRLLYSLVTETPLEQMKQSSDPDSIQFQLQMSLNTRFLKKKSENDCKDREEYAIEKAWFKSVNEFLMIVLKDFLIMEIDDITDECINNKEKRTQNQTDVHDKEDILYSYVCSSKLNLWQRPKTYSKKSNTDINLGIIEREVEVTKKMMESFRDDISLPNLIKFELSLIPKYNPARILINVKKIMSYKKLFKMFIDIFPKKITSWVEIYEKEMNGQK